MAKRGGKRIIGVLLCLAAVAVVVAGCVWARESSQTSTDNAYIRGDVTSLAPKIAEICSPEWSETGKLYDFPSDRVLAFRAPD